MILGYLGDCLKVMADMKPGSADAIVTDPPYGIDFMGKEWDSFTGKPKSQGGKEFPDYPLKSHGKTITELSKGNLAYQQWCESWARECLRVLKPGGHMLAFGGTRTYHRLACAVEDAGFEIRDSLHWIYGSGFPKSLDVSKAIDKAAGAEREVIDSKRQAVGVFAHSGSGTPQDIDAYADAWQRTKPSTAEAQQWEGWGTALKPAHEPIIFARKPLAGKTVASNVIEYGTGGINVNACRVAALGRPARKATGGNGEYDGWGNFGHSKAIGSTDQGRWPPNVILTHSPGCNDECMHDCPVAEIDRQSGISKTPSKVTRGPDRTPSAFGLRTESEFDVPCYGDTGGASRFFPVFRYQAKAPRSERPSVDGVPAHPTVKPLALMQWLVRLVTPPGGLVLDPFAGTGTTAEACQLEGFDCILIEKDPGNMKLINERLGANVVA